MMCEQRRRMCGQREAKIERRVRAVSSTLDGWAGRGPVIARWQLDRASASSWTRYFDLSGQGPCMASDCLNRLVLTNSNWPHGSSSRCGTFDIPILQAIAQKGPSCHGCGESSVWDEIWRG